MFFEKRGHKRDQKTSGAKIEIEEIKSPVSETMIFICEKCGRKLDRTDEDGENLARSLQKAIKKESKRTDSKRKVRAVLTGCLDVCPKRAIAIAVGQLSEAPLKFYLIDEEELEGAETRLLEFVKPVR
jgi:predicted metal-binding protein